MAILTPGRRLACLLFAATMLATGCNLLALPYFILPMDNKYPPQLLKLASDNKKKNVKVVILSYLGTEGGAELIQVDRDLSSKLARQLSESFKENDEKVEIIAPRKVEKFKNDHPDWHAMELHDIGKHFEADYVIYLEINAIDLYEKGSGNLMYRGRASIEVDVVDMAKTDDDPLSKPFKCEYPARGPVPIDDTNLEGFRHAFVEYIAKRISWYFTAHGTNSEYSFD